MENSIEEDMVRIAKLITTKFNNDYSIDNKDKEAIEHILSDYKRVLKENEELVVENQQYYIIQKQMEKYEKHIKKLQKENEELNLKYYMLYTGKIENLKAQEVKIKSQVIPVQEVKDKIEEYKNMLKTCNKAKERR